MNRSKVRFLLALTLFAGWVLGLGAMAFLSGESPQARPQAPASR